ncbi:P-loop containing nucleoside triphosphate hydrolase protein [Pilobolus umbonatus]|nr:P-loop containing nucleoside triphosphate hydrolase protein [Pilobolus umbonatus]
MHILNKPYLTKRPTDKHSFLLVLIGLVTGCRIQTSPSGRLTIVFKWQYLLISLLVACFTTIIFMSTYSSVSVDQQDEETVFSPITSPKVSSRWKNYISNKSSVYSTTSSQLYFSRNCPGTPSCAKPVPSFIFAGSEFSGSEYVFQLLQHHPQVIALIDKETNVFDKEEFDESSAFETYMAPFPFLNKSSVETMKGKHWVVGEHAPQYLYKSHLTAKRLRATLPHIKLVFLLRDPIKRAYSQYLYEKPAMKGSVLSFEELMDLEIPILRRCGHTSTQSEWEGFVKCHEGSEIRASWKSSQNKHQFNLLAKGMYYPALLPFYRHFPPSQLFLMGTEDILLNPVDSLHQLAEFLNIDPHHFVHRQENESIAQQLIQKLLVDPTLNLNPIEDQPKLSTTFRLQRIFRQMNERLVETFDNTKTQFNGWIYDVDRG